MIQIVGYFVVDGAMTPSSNLAPPSVRPPSSAVIDVVVGYLVPQRAIWIMPWRSPWGPVRGGELQGEERRPEEAAAKEVAAKEVVNIDVDVSPLL